LGGGQLLKMITVKAVFVRNWGKNKLGAAVPKFPVSG